jgi:soluble lytic murein transglycosylase-like protein
LHRSSIFSLHWRMKRLVKLTLVIVAFFSVPSIFKNTLIALTISETTSEKKIESAPIKSLDTPYDRMISAAGTRYGVDPELIRLVIGQESGFKPNARSPKNAQGLMQLIPETAQRFGIKNPYDPQQNINGGTRYLSWLLNRFDGDVKLALAGYNAGENAVKRYGNKVPPYKETRQYVKKITAAYGNDHHTVPAQPRQPSRAVAAMQ